MGSRRDILQASFTSGEFSPLLSARIDTERYGQAARKLENMVVLRQGPVMRRPGSIFVNRTRNLDQAVRLIPFDVDNDRSYVIEMGDRYARIYTDRGQVSRSSTPIELQTPYSTEDLPCLRWVRQGNKMWLVCPRHPPTELDREGHYLWHFRPLTFLDGSGNSKVLPFDERDYPSVVWMHDDRLVLAGTRLRPQTIWISRKGLYNNFTEETFHDALTDTDQPTADSRLVLKLNARELNTVRWMSSSRLALVVGTAGSIWLVFGPDGGVLTPSSVAARAVADRGSADIEPVRIGQTMLFVQRDGRAIRELSFVFDADDFRSPDLTVFADHLTRSGIQELAWQKDPDSLIWCRLGDGTLGCFTYDPEQEIVAWHHHRLAGDGKVESMTVVPSPDGGGDDLWVSVARTHNGQEYRSIEIIPGTPRQNEIGIAWLDSAIRYQGPPARILAGLEHLEGQLVSILADQASQAPRRVREGRLELDSPASEVVIGLPYNSEIQTLPFGSSPLGSWFGKPTRYRAVQVELAASFPGIEAGPVGGPLSPLGLPDDPPLLDAPPPLLAGIHNINWAPSDTRSASITIRTRSPGPMTILGIGVQLQTYER